MKQCFTVSAASADPEVVLICFLKKKQWAMFILQVMTGSWYFPFVKKNPLYKWRKNIWTKVIYASTGFPFHSQFFLILTQLIDSQVILVLSYWKEVSLRITSKCAWLSFRDRQNHTYRSCIVVMLWRNFLKHSWAAHKLKEKNIKVTKDRKEARV